MRIPSFSESLKLQIHPSRERNNLYTRPTLIPDLSTSAFLENSGGESYERLQEINYSLRRYIKDT